MLTPTIDFQEATTRDIEALIPLIRAYYEFEEIRFDDTAIRRGLAQFMADRSLGGAWLLVDAGARVGYFVLTYGSLPRADAPTARHRCVGDRLRRGLPSAPRDRRARAAGRT